MTNQVPTITLPNEMPKIEGKPTYETVTLIKRVASRFYNRLLHTSFEYSVVSLWSSLRFCTVLYRTVL